MTRRHQAATATSSCLLLALVIGGCWSTADPSPADTSATSSPSPSVGSVLTDLSVIGCAGDDPADEGELTGAWAGVDVGVYYIRQVGDCVWWFGTEVTDVELGPTRQPGFANVASGRVVGTQVDLEWVDLPLGDTVNGGGLTFIYDGESGQLTFTEQRGGTQPFGDIVLTRIQPDAAPSSAPSTTLSPSTDSVLTDLSAIGCAGDDPADEGELTGAWSGNDSGTYYIRHVGDCVWWFGTEVRDLELGPVGQRGFANVASGRIVGNQVDLEWADVPLGSTVNGGGLTFIYDEESDELRLSEQRGGNQPFGGTVLTRIQPDASSSPTPSATPTP